ncbi:MAG TPA: formate dehydrogenase accessory sulfurtransferase FdhD [Streptosporangiaceae bacterium]|nr:formate dehydrogenase accessory sulfurtransferase FdhD [Streptosporangiaceae bacterium]
MGSRTARRRVLRISVHGPSAHRADMLAVEEPLEIRIGGTPLTVTMRTPGDDIDLAAGFLFCEGLLNPSVDLRQIRMCDENVADVTLEVAAGRPAEVPAAPAAPAPRLPRRPQDIGWPQEDTQVLLDTQVAAQARRNFLTTSACGVCGKESIDAIRVKSRYDVAADPAQVSPGVLASLPDRLRDAQKVFASTGGLHAAGLFTADGTLLALREDVGRHNAVDKIVGWALRDGRLPLSGHVLLVSGRASFELVQKAYMAGIPVLAAVSAPSSLAVGLAEEAGMTLVGFLRGESMNAYTGAHRLMVATLAKH